MGMGERITERLEALDMSQAELARRVGIKQPSINHLIKKGAGGSAHLHKIARELGTSPEYLTGETDNADAVGKGRLSYSAEQSPAQSAKELNSVLIPELQIGYSMGGGSVFEEYQQKDLVTFPRDWLSPIMRGSFEELFVARGSGDSMIPTLLDGDRVIVDTARKAIDDQDRLWCLSYGDLGMIKRVRMQPDGGALIMSDNPAVSPITAYDDEMHVIGRVIWIARRV